MHIMFCQTFIIIIIIINYYYYYYFYYYYYYYYYDFLVSDSFLDVDDNKWAFHSPHAFFNDIHQSLNTQIILGFDNLW